MAEVARPEPGHGELLIRIRATAVAAGDCELRALRFSLGFRVLVRLLMGPIRPRRKVLGQEFAGDVEAIGEGVTRFRVGDAVFGTTGFRFGAYAEFLTLREHAGDSVVATKPTNMSYLEAATVPTGGLEAYRFLRTTGKLSGSRVLVIGAGGGIGLNAVQLAKDLGASVTGVETTGRLDLVRSLGADRVIDYTRGPSAIGDANYDVIFDVVGAAPFAATMRSLAPGGVFLAANPTLGTLVRGAFRWSGRGKKVVLRAPRSTTEDLDALRVLIDAGRLRAVIDREYPLAEIPEAHRYVDAGHARGRVAIAV